MIRIHLNSISRAIIFLLVAVGFSFLIPNNTMAKDTVDILTEGSSGQLPAGRLALVPFVKGSFAEEFRQKNLSPLICPINQVCLDLTEGDETIFFVEVLNKHLRRMMKKKVGENLYPKEYTKSIYEAIPLDPIKDTTLSRSLVLAQKMKADYVLVPILWNYSELVGSSLSAEKPASVSFGLYLVSAKMGKRVWKSKFTKTQMALTDNILNVKDMFKFGGKWVTAEELAQVGMEKILEDFPLSSN